MGKCILAGHAVSNLRIATGSYAGTGTGTVTLTFPFTPKLLIVANHNRAGCYAAQDNRVAGQGFVVIYGTTKYIVGQRNLTATFPSAQELNFTWNEKSVSWSGPTREWAANDINNNYDWLIIG